jgi:hypothetical protein
MKILPTTVLAIMALASIVSFLLRQEIDRQDYENYHEESFSIGIQEEQYHKENSINVTPDSHQN